MASIKTDWNKLDSLVEARMQHIIEATVDFIVEEAKRNVPVVTGELRDSIRVLVMERLHASVGTDVEHGTYVEFGTSTQSPHPWLEPAVRSALENISRFI